MPSPSTGTVIKSLSEKLRTTWNMFSVVKGNFYDNIFKYVSLRIMPINVLNMNFPEKDKF